MTQQELDKLLGNTPKFRLTFRNYDDPNDIKIVDCFRWYHSAPTFYGVNKMKGDTYAQLEKDGKMVNIEDINYYLDEWVEL